MNILGLWMFGLSGSVLPNSFGCGRDVHSTPIVSDGLSEAHHGHLMGGAELPEKVFQQVRNGSDEDFSL